MTPPEITQLKELLERLVNHHHNPFEPDSQSRLYVDVLKARDVQFPALLTALESNQKRVEELEQTNRAKVDECARLSSAIKRALNDSESGNGWGPDVTACGYLRAALHPEAGEGEKG